MNLIDENNNLPAKGKLKSFRRITYNTKCLKSPYFKDSSGINIDDRKSMKLLSCTINDSRSLLRLQDSFFSCPCISLAQSLLGKILVRKMPSGVLIKGLIVETESYLGVEDMASHSYKGKKTDRNEAMYLKPGTAYVYTIYGMYYCFNISSLEEGSAVLVRALEPLEGIDTMLENRIRSRKSSQEVKIKQLCNGPSKLCQAFKIEKDLFNKVDLTLSENLWVEEGKSINTSSVISCKRIGIDSYGEVWANKPLRFYIKGNNCVSRKCKMTEKIHEERVTAELH